MGAALFVREKGRARLTPLGQRLLPTLSQAFDSIEAAFVTHKVEDESLLTVTTTHTFANTWLAWRLGGFQMEHPDLAVRMTTSNETIDLRSGEADVAVRAGLGDWPGLEMHKLMESNFTPMASPECIAKFERDLGRSSSPRTFCLCRDGRMMNGGRAGCRTGRRALDSHRHARIRLTARP